MKELFFEKLSERKWISCFFIALIILLAIWFNPYSGYLENASKDAHKQTIVIERIKNETLMKLDNLDPSKK